VAPDGEGNTAVELGHAVGRIDTAGITLAGGAAPEMEAAGKRGMGGGEESAGITGLGANHKRTHENKTRTNLVLVKQARWQWVRNGSKARFHERRKIAGWFLPTPLGFE